MRALELIMDGNALHGENVVEAAKEDAAEITRLRAELERVISAVEVALAHFDVGETDAGKDVLSSALEGEEGK